MVIPKSGNTFDLSKQGNMKQKMLSELKKGDVISFDDYTMDMDFCVTEVKLTKAGRVKVFGSQIWTNKETKEVIRSTSDMCPLHNGAVSDVIINVK